jgi:hypothetical protein
MAQMSYDMGLQEGIMRPSRTGIAAVVAVLSAAGVIAAVTSTGASAAKPPGGCSPLGDRAG